MWFEVSLKFASYALCKGYIEKSFIVSQINPMVLAHDVITDFIFRFLGS